MHRNAEEYEYKGDFSMYPHNKTGFRRIIFSTLILHTTEEKKKEGGGGDSNILHVQVTLDSIVMLLVHVISTQNFIR